MRPQGLVGWGLIVGSTVIALGFAISGNFNEITLDEVAKRQLTHKIRAELQNGEVIYGIAGSGLPVVVTFKTHNPVNAAESWCYTDPEGLVQRGINVSEYMAAQNWRRFLSETIPHEVAHLLRCEMGDQNWDDHSPAWETIVRDMGAVPYPFHSYEYARQP